MNIDLLPSPWPWRSPVRLQGALQGRGLLALWLSIPLLLALLVHGLEAKHPLPGMSGQGSAVAASALAQRVHARCVEQMLQSTCVAMRGAPAAASAAPLSTPARADARPSLVFIAGLGPVDAQAYRQIREAGEAMCNVALRACDANPGSDACRTAQSLWLR